MRGPATLHQRAGAKPPPVNEAIGKPYTLASPYEGWNANGNLSTMPPRQAVLMDNVFPDVANVRLREGSLTWKTGLATNIKTLHSYEGSAGSKLFAASDAGVYDATTTGAFGAAEFACTSGKWFSTNFTTSGGQFLCMVNGVDGYRVYNGSTWQSITGVSVPALTGIAVASLANISAHKKRLWFVEKNSMNLWYLPTESFAGAAVVYPVGALFKKGGKVVATGTWTLDAGNGSDDYFVIVTSQGELAVYVGTDPSSSTTWALVGVYEVGLPVGTRPFCDFGGDLLYLSENGLFPLSKFLQSTIVDKTSALSFLVQGAYLPMVTAYKNVHGWQILPYRRGNALIMNLPIAEDTSSVQFVMNLTTKAWCRFTGWNASCMVESGGQLYFAVGGKVFFGWSGQSDSGAPIQGDVIQAYNSFGYSAQKQITLIRPHFAYDNNLTAAFAIDADFRSISDYSQQSYSFLNDIGIWNVGEWDNCVWSFGLLPLRPVWMNVYCDLGFLHALRVKIVSSTATVEWAATNFLYSPGGIL